MQIPQNRALLRVSYIPCLSVYRVHWKPLQAYSEPICYMQFIIEFTYCTSLQAYSEPI